MNAAQQAIVAQWQQRVHNAGLQIQKLMEQASAGAQQLIVQSPTDLMPLDRALAAIANQVDEQRRNAFEADDEIYDRLCRANPGSRQDATLAVAQWRQARHSFDRWVEETWDRLAVHWQGEQLRAMWPHVQQAMAGPVPCNRCGAPLQRATPRAAESITCGACRSVNQLSPAAMIVAYFGAAHRYEEPGIIDKRMALKKLKDDWEDYREAEHAAGRARPDEPIERLQQREQLVRDYRTAYFAARFKYQGGDVEEVKRSVERDMEQGFYAEMNRNDVWRAAHSQPSVADLTTVPAHLQNVDEWGPLDPRQNPNAAEDDMVHEYVLGEVFGEPQRHEAFLKGLGYRDRLQRLMTHATFRRYYDNLWSTPEGQQSMQRAVSRATSERMRLEALASGVRLDLIEGVSVQDYARLEAKLAKTTPADFLQALAEQGLDQPRWEGVRKGWCDRMRDDRSNLIYTEYTKAYLSTGQLGEAGAAALGAIMGHEPSQNPVAGAEPAFLERYCEIQGAYNAWRKQGKDPNANLEQHFKLTATDVSNIAMYWMQRMMTEPAVSETFSRLVDASEKQYLAIP